MILKCLVDKCFSYVSLVREKKSSFGSSQNKMGRKLILVVCTVRTASAAAAASGEAMLPTSYLFIWETLTVVCRFVGPKLLVPQMTANIRTLNDTACVFVEPACQAKLSVISRYLHQNVKFRATKFTHRSCTSRQ